ncbi:MAG: hypothetical protein AAF587_14995 [Bacteroidota bacterium]
MKSSSISSYNNSGHLIAWTDDQDPLTRRSMVGTGILCGLTIHTDEHCYVHLSPGVAITSSGKMIQIASPLTFKYYRPFTAPEPYPFLTHNQSGKAYPVWELFSSPESDCTPIAPQSREEVQHPFVKNKVAVLFISSPKDVLDGMGEVEDQEKIHVLLLEKTSMIQEHELQKQLLRAQIKENSLDPDFIWEEDFSLEDNLPQQADIDRAMDPRLLLKEIPLRRFGFGPEPHTYGLLTAVNGLDDVYQLYRVIIDEAIGQLDRELRRVTDLLQHLLGYPKDAETYRMIDELCKKWETYLKKNTIDEHAKKEYVQYFYGWMRDLLQAYHELRHDFLSLVDNCGADPDRYPRHIILGWVMGHNPALVVPEFRQGFEQPPIVNGNKDRIQRIRLYYWRILMMIRGFYLPDYVDDADLNPYCITSEDEDEEPAPEFDELKVTPGRWLDQPIGRQSIPYYYLLSQSKYSVHRYWEYSRAKTHTSDHHLSYHANEVVEDMAPYGLESYSDLPQVIDPLRFYLGEYSFFRIEGHIGRLREEVGMDLQSIRRSHHLPFDFTFIQVDSLVTNGDGYAFSEEFWGMEHIGGVKEGGTFVLLFEPTDEGDRVIADFALPYRCCPSKSPLSQIGIHPPPQEGVQNNPPSKTQKLSGSSPPSPTEGPNAPSPFSGLGTASEATKDDLSKISGIGKKMVQTLNGLGIYTFKQVSNMKAKEYRLLDEYMSGPNKGKAKRDDWAGQAKKLL